MYITIIIIIIIIKALVVCEYTEMSSSAKQKHAIKQ